MTRFLLDSGDPEDYKEIKNLASFHNVPLWGATTNPTLIAKKLAGSKISKERALDIQKQIVLQIIDMVPGAVSAEVYADEQTTAGDMILQGKEIATWHPHVVVKLPTTLEGFKARTALRKQNIMINNTLVFSQEQIFAICLHERIATKQFGIKETPYPCFISPFVGRLDDIGIDGISLVANGIKMKQVYGFSPWMLEASVRNSSHIQKGLDLATELITAPLKVYREWFAHQKTPPSALSPIEYWEPPKEFFEIDTIDEFMQALESKKLLIDHELTTKGLIQFAQDWNAIIQ